MAVLVFVLYCSWAVLLCLSVQAYENLALHQPAWQSSTWRSNYTADLAVDGQYTDLAWNGGQCAVSYDGQTAEWRVDLGGVKNIHHVLIHHVKCKDTNYTTTTINYLVNITCPYHGRYVIYYNNRTHLPYPNDYTSITAIALCEVEVYDCPSPGYYGENCSLKCPKNCHDGYCDSMEGTCPACKPGFIGPRCMECDAGLYGNNCSKNCSLTCENPGVCHKVTGHCNGSCLAGSEGDMCENVPKLFQSVQYMTIVSFLGYFVRDLVSTSSDNTTNVP
ncbi:uncharacterized protein LOC111112074 [Crassostrea virginica]